jgi:hypothetical protein
LPAVDTSKYSAKSSSSSDDDLEVTSPPSLTQNGSLTPAVLPPRTPENNTIFGAKFSRCSFQEISQADLLREKLLSSKSEKVKGEGGAIFPSERLSLPQLSPIGLRVTFLLSIFSYLCSLLVSIHGSAFSLHPFIFPSPSTLKWNGALLRGRVQNIFISLAKMS